METLVIDGFETLTQQQMFDMAVEHIQKTREKSFTENYGCCYSGTGCGASVFIKTEMREAADPIGAWDNVVRHKKAPAHEQEFVNALQKAHDFSDDAVFMEQWNFRMRDLADQHGLDVSKLEPL